MAFFIIQSWDYNSIYSIIVIWSLIFLIAIYIFFWFWSLFKNIISFIFAIFIFVFLMLKFWNTILWIETKNNITSSSNTSVEIIKKEDNKTNVEIIKKEKNWNVIVNKEVEEIKVIKDTDVIEEKVIENTNKKDLNTDLSNYINVDKIWNNSKFEQTIVNTIKLNWEIISKQNIKNGIEVDENWNIIIKK